MRHLAPAGTRITLGDLVRWAGAVLSSGRRKRELATHIERNYLARSSFAVSSGRAALCLILSALKVHKQNRTEVVLPSYTCYSLPACVIRCGLKVRIADVDPHTLRLSHDSLLRADMSNVLAIIPTSLYGIPEELPVLENIAQSSNTHLIDDAAQAMGARVSARAVGTFGDAGLFSFDKGKTLTSIQGGVAMAGSRELAETMDSLWLQFPRPTIGQAVTLLGQSFAYATMIHPFIYAIPASLPQLKLGQTVYDEDFPVTRYARLQEAMAASLFARIDEIIGHRRAIASLYLEALDDVPGVSAICPPSDSWSTYVRFPVMFDDPKNRDRILGELIKQGLGATGSYPASIADIPKIAGHVAGEPDCEGGKTVARGIMTLPTHEFVTEKDVGRIVDTLRSRMR